jgi:hypothetical protein
MEKYNLEKNVKVFGVIVETFPEGVGEAFEGLMKKLGDGFNRSYYGISEMKENQLVYKAVVEEKYDEEAEKYKLEKFNIESGTYFTIILKDWQNNTECIKDIFQKMMESEKVDKRKPCVEWYKTNDEMLCMMKSI